MRFLPVSFAACLLTITFVSSMHCSIAGAQEVAVQNDFELKNDPLEASGPLKKISDAQDLFELSTVGTKLETKVVASSQDAQASISQIRTQTRSGGGSSNSGNGNWMAYFQGNDFFGHVSNGKIAAHMLMRFPNLKAVQDDSEFTLQFQELKSPQRELSIAVGDDNVFHIFLRSSELGYLFRFRQEKNGRVVCQELSNEFVFARSANSFDEFAKQNPDYVQGRLMKVFDFIGVEKPPTRFSTVVRNQVLLMLRPINEERMSRFRKAVEEMSASSYQDRESATADIEKNFEQWRDLIQIGMRDENFAVETRTRLTKIYGDKVDKATKQLMKLAQVSKLHQDTEYLIWALGKTEEQADKMAIAKQLSKLTEQDIELDVSQWNSWFVENHKPQQETIERTKRDQVGEQTGPIDSASEFVQQLTRFSNNQGELQLDRNHWGKPFGDKPIADSVTQVEELMKKNNLPREWLSHGGKFSADSAEFPQVIFANMAAQLESEDDSAKPQQPTYGYLNQNGQVTRNRFVNTSKINAQMQFHQETGNAMFGRVVAVGKGSNLPAAKYFYLYFKEITDAKRVLEIRESENKTISITLISDQADTVIRMVQHPATNKDIPAESRFVIYDIRGDQTRELKGANFDELFQRKTDYFQDEWLPLMKKFGIQIEMPNSKSE